MWETITETYRAVFEAPASSGQMILCLIVLISIGGRLGNMGTRLRDMDQRLSALEKLIRTLPDSN
jgi:hypothetical protein